MAKKQYGSVMFPFEETDLENQVCLKRTENVEDTIKSCIRAFFLTRPHQRRGNRIGSVLHEYKHQLISKGALTVVENEVGEELHAYFRGIEFLSIQVTQDIDSDTKIPTLYLSLQFALPGKSLQSLSFSV